MELRDVTERYSFLLQKFAFVAQRCQLLEDTCRGLLDSSAQASEQAIQSVQTYRDFTQAGHHDTTNTGIHGSATRLIVRMFAAVAPMGVG